MVTAQDSQPTAFREAEKKYQLHKEQLIRVSKGRKHGGKLHTRLTDFADVLDVSSQSVEQMPGVCRLQSKVLDKAVYSLTRHPGCYVVPGLLTVGAQMDLFRQALTTFPEPPNRSNLTAHHGHLPSLWPAAQQGLFLKPYATNTNEITHPSATSSCNLPHMQRQRAATAHPTESYSQPPVNNSSKQVDTKPLSATHDSSDTCPSTTHLTGASWQGLSDQPLHLRQGYSTLKQAQPADQRQDSSCVASRSGDLEGESSCWSSSPEGPSAASLLQKLRWVALGPQFNWSTRQYEHEPGVKPLSSELVMLAQHVVQACKELDARPTSYSGQTSGDVLSWKDNVSYADAALCNANGAGSQVDDSCNSLYEPDTALVNFYREADTLGGHKDDAEVHGTCPIVSLSLGCDGVFLMGGQTKDVAPTALWLHSGDAVVLSGAARQCYHGVPRVIPGQCCFDERDCHHDLLDEAIHTYMQSTRVNISIRQT